MNKYTILGLVNVLLCGFFVFTFAKAPHLPLTINLNTLVHGYLPDLVLLFAVVLNGYLAHKFLIKKEKKASFPLSIIFTFSTFLWIAFMSIGFFFASNIAFPILSIILVVGMYLLVKKYSPKAGLLLSLITLLVVILTFEFGFEEDYCWEKGDEMAVGKPVVIKISSQEEKEVFGDLLGEPTTSDSAEVGTSAYYHFKCHDNFNLGNAMKEKYLLLPGFSK